MSMLFNSLRFSENVLQNKSQCKNYTRKKIFFIGNVILKIMNIMGIAMRALFASFMLFKGVETFAERLQSFVQQSSSVSSTNMTQRQKSQNSRPPIKKDVAFFGATRELSKRSKKLRNAILTIKPSSVEAERAFSTTGKFLTRFRASMKDEHISALVFLKAHFSAENCRYNRTK
ncbi:hypothetical protein CAPTEDRAFT_193487 [Capitella teleta]|uniref:HAT C-terminal dimerisation domain-containing protein n=1 Tax=Capitella teleta TaxID=283909 RepID=R7U0F7_CAPTE|nr:hypothetical protein CAPTEDRAFT_193487 [Capitella teleta]|eukprot:ELT97151.1 hypothetical protein CAPTEDRAFT_193487 [Capitella teleta]